MNEQPRSESKRLLWVIPNYRTSPSLTNYVPLAPREKFKIATEDSTDRGTFVLAALFGAEAQLTNSERSFGQGVKGYARYFATSYSDWAIGKLHDRSLVSDCPASRPALYPPLYLQRMVKARLCRG